MWTVDWPLLAYNVRIMVTDDHGADGADQPGCGSAECSFQGAYISALVASNEEEIHHF